MDSHTQASDSYYTLRKEGGAMLPEFDKKQLISGYKKDGNLITWEAMYQKYSSSQDYYYSRDINDILANGLSSAVITWQDTVTYLEEEELLKRIYP